VGSEKRQPNNADTYIHARWKHRRTGTPLWILFAFQLRAFEEIRFAASEATRDITGYAGGAFGKDSPFEKRNPKG
jgi:hypothetical protein